jgi:hypothetical protein
MAEYERYCKSDSGTDNGSGNGASQASKDIAPLYLFDPDVLQSNSYFANGQDRVADDLRSIPECFAHDAMAGLTGSQFRPLPPAWLLVGVTRSGTPIHDHPLFVAWNALLMGCKLWCCLPPNVDESVLQLQSYSDNGSDDDNDNDDCTDNSDDFEFEFDTSALQWFANCATSSCGNDNSTTTGTSTLGLHNLPDSAKIIVQQPGEVAYEPPTWWHAVLNIETSTAICYSLTLKRDIPQLFPKLSRSDEDFARSWWECMSPAERELASECS